MAPISRRAVLQGAAGSALAAQLGGWSVLERAWARDRSAATVARPDGTTLAATILPVGPGPYRTTGEGPGEPLLVRADLVDPRPGREDRRTVLASLVHFTDQHLIDAQSPGRVEFLDPADALFQSAFRPQELLTTQVATSMVARVEALGRGPVTGRRFDAVVCTGDNIDNQQRNELGWLLQVLDGGTIVPDSGALGTYEGVQDDVDVLDPYWHPEPGIVDAYKTTLGYPDLPGLAARAIAPFASPGLSVPWYSVYGNHDANVQGNAARTDALDAIFTGDRKMVGLPSGEAAVPFVLRVMGDSPSVLADLQSGALPSREVTPDPARRTATIADWIAGHLASPTGTHGYDAADLAARRLHYEFEVAPGVIGLAMDTTNHAGGPRGADGSIGAGQLAWLEERLEAAGDRLALLFSHHSSRAMTADDPDPARPDERRVLGPELVEVLLRHRNVVAWINGHSHTNEVVAHADAERPGGGFWEITSASHVDWPQQARIVEVVDNGDRTLSLFTTMIEHLGPAEVDHDGSDPVALSAISRELGLNDAQAGPLGKAGSPTDRNLELVLATPPPVDPPPSTTTVPAPAPAPTAPGAAPVPGAVTYTG